MKFKAQIRNGELQVSSKVKEYLKEKEGTFFECEEDNRESDELRGYFEGAIVPTWFYLHPKSKWKSFSDARDSLKLEFNSGVGFDKHGVPIRVAKTTAMSRAKWRSFLERINEYFNENGMMQWWPDPEEYKRWRDSAPEVDAVYPPLLALKTEYTRQKDESVPPWRR